MLVLECPFPLLGLEGASVTTLGAVGLTVSSTLVWSEAVGASVGVIVDGYGVSRFPLTGDVVVTPNVAATVGVAVSTFIIIFGTVGAED